MRVHSWRVPEFGGHKPAVAALLGATVVVILGRVVLAHGIPGASLNARAIAIEGASGLALLGFAYLAAALHWLPAVVIAAGYAALYTANLEMIAAMDTVLRLQDVVFATDEVFLRGSAAALQFAVFGVLLTAVCVLFALVATRAHRAWPLSRRRLAIAAAMVAALTGLVFALPSGFGWIEDGAVRTSLQRSLQPAGVSGVAMPGDPEHQADHVAEAERPEADPELNERGDLDGELLIPRAEENPNVLLVIIEGIPGVYLEQVQEATGVEYPVTMPRFSSIAESGLLATQSIAHARQTIRGLYSAFTGDYPRLDLATPKIYPYMQADESVRPPGLASAMRRLGYKTVYLQAADLSYMSKDRFMPEVGFEEVLGKEAFEYSHVPFEWGPDDKAYFEQVEDYLDELDEDNEGDTPWFVSLLTVGTHHPYGVTDEYAADYPSRKIASVAYLDEALGEFFDRLEDSGRLADTAVFIVSDESHGVTGRPLGRYWGTTVVRTPELTADTATSEKPVLQRQPVGLRDVPISILDYLGAEDEARTFAGRSFLRTYDSGREIWFGPYLAKPDGDDGADDGAGPRTRIYHVPERGRVEIFVPSTGAPFAPEYTRRQKREQEHPELFEQLRESYGAATHIPGVEYAVDEHDEPPRDPRAQSWVLVEDARERLAPGEARMLSGAQYLEIPADTVAELRLEISAAEAPEGDGDGDGDAGADTGSLVRPSLQILAEYEPLEIELPSMPDLAAGESFETTVSFEAEEKLERVWVDLRAQSLSETHEAEVRVHELTLELSPRSANTTENNENPNRRRPEIEPVAHAGGRYADTTYTNSVEALEQHAESYNLFEIDFEWTSDRRLVGLHDWDVIFERLYGFRPEQPLSYDEFRRLESPLGVTPVTLDLLQEFLDRHPHTFIVTDIKSDNLDALAKIAERIEDHEQRIIPQVYHPGEFGAAAELGYERIIWTLYRFAPNRDTERVVSEALELRDTYRDALFAVAMPTVVVEDGTAEALGEHGIPSFAHTVNSCDEYLRLRELGADSIYSDDLAPGSCPAPLSVLSFNVRLAGAPDGKDGWEHRREQVFEVIADHNPDLVGLQEPELVQLRELKERFPEYTFLGRSVEGGGIEDNETEGKFNALMIRRRRFEVLADDTFWFSPDPEQPGSRDPEAALARICTWAKLRDRAGNRTVYLYNLHLDYASQAARERSTELLLERILARPGADDRDADDDGAGDGAVDGDADGHAADGHAEGARTESAHDDVVLVTGDFNANELNPALRLLLEGGDRRPRDPRPLRDTFAAVHEGEKEAYEYGTFHDFTGEPQTTKIDFVLAPESVKVLEAGIDRRSRDGRYPSDHFPVYAVLQLTPQDTLR